MYRPIRRTAVVRTARPSDAVRLGDLVRSTFLSTYQHLPPDCVQTHLAEISAPTAIEAVVSAVDRAVAVVERPDGALVGFSHARPAPHPAAVGRRPAMLSQLYLLPEHHGGGIGVALMTSVERWAVERDHDELWLNVWAGNSHAIGFYTRAGFRTVGATAVRVGGCTDLDLVMSRALP